MSPAILTQVEADRKMELSGGRAPEAVPGGWASWEWHGRVPGEARGPAGPPPARARPPAPRVPALGHARRAGGEHRAVRKRLRRPRDSEPARGPSLSSHPGPGAAPGAESVRSPGVLEVARVGKLATARGVAVESRRAAGHSHIHTFFNCLMLVQIQCPPRTCHRLSCSP